jgi:hypothetical protein
VVSRQGELPGVPSFTRRAPWSPLDRFITAFALALPLALMVDGLVFRSLIAWTGGIATIATGTFLLVLWSLETRAVAIGPGWLAVRARLAPSWVVVPVADIVTVRRRRFVRSGLAVKLSSGPPVFVRKGDLEAGMAAAMSQHLGLRSPVEAALAELRAERDTSAAPDASRQTTAAPGIPGAATPAPPPEGGGVHAGARAVGTPRAALLDRERAGSTGAPRGPAHAAVTAAPPGAGDAAGDRASAGVREGPTVDLRLRIARRARRGWSQWLRRWSTR